MEIQTFKKAVDTLLKQYNRSTAEEVADGIIYDGEQLKSSAWIDDSEDDETVEVNHLGSLASGLQPSVWIIIGQHEEKEKWLRTHYHLPKHELYIEHNVNIKEQLEFSHSVSAVVIVLEGEIPTTSYLQEAIKGAEKSILH
ncbi:hypothetical protein CEE35_03975 [Candidatus Aerophobetes bacterium Ae_b3b]|nr:MAG: hypothetical protein CEE35_03975 [Candidatus Aerophobetes bacterium Ae_b3b]